MSESAVVKIEEEEEVDKRNDDEENGAVAEDGITSKQVTIRQIVSAKELFTSLLFLKLTVVIFAVQPLLCG